MDLSYAAGREFVEDIRPFLDRHDLDGLLQRLCNCWPNEQLEEMLHCGCDDARKAALLCLSFEGDSGNVPAIAELLKSGDRTVSTLAEHALWSIWFRDGSSCSNLGLIDAVHHLGEDDLDEALRILSEIIANEPSFAEPYNQRAITYFLKDDYDRAVRDYRRALRLNPFHFGALAGLGHCYAALGKLPDALRTYEQLLEMHPWADGIKEAITEIKSKLSYTSHSPLGIPPSWMHWNS
jgi:tetratricopeptide (TPR) repeat protein